MNPDPIAIFQKKHVDRMMILGGVLLAAVALLVGGIMIVRSEAARVKEARTERLQVMADLNAIAKLSDGKKDADMILPELQADLPESLDIPVTVIPRIRALAASRNVKIDFKLNDAQPTGFNGFSGISFTLRAEGTLTGITNFLSDIENAKNIMSITDWNIGRNGPVADLTAFGLIYVRLTAQ